jgi:hypothetical protein
MRHGLRKTDHMILRVEVCFGHESTFLLGYLSRPDFDLTHFVVLE